MKQTIILLFFTCFCLAVSAEDSRTTVEDSVYRTKKKFDYFYLEALRLKQSDKHGEAYAALQYALKIDSTSSSALALMANYYLFLQEDSLAIEALKKAVIYDSENFEYKVSLAEIYRETGDLSGATELYEQLAAEHPEKSELHFYLSDLYLKQNRIDKAIQSLDALENSIGMSEALSMQKYKLYLAVEQKENAINELEKLAAKNPSETKYQILIGDFYLENGDSDKALTYYEKAHKIDPQSPYYVASMAGYYEKKGDTEAAVQEIESALKNPVLDVDTKISILGKYLGDRLSNQKEVEAADSLFKTLMEQYSQEKELNMMYGQFLVSQGKWEEARVQFQLVTEANPENSLAWRLLMNIAIREENADEIIRICNSALAVFPDDFEFYYYKGSAYYQLKNYPEALAVFQEGIPVIPEDDKPSLSRFYGIIGDLYHQMNQKKESYQAYDKSLEYNENNIVVLNNYAYFLSLDKEDLDKAERMISKCIKLQPNEPTYIDTYAWVFFQKGNYTLAKFYIESAISNGGQSSDILEHYGDILYKTGNTDKAVEQWEKALEIKEMGEDTSLLEKKIENKMYYESK
ncbi:MAG: tetratricopeptide repeat protein [Candidatus Azobacteroides sp.]|nr:tetratricopeptide repeat protein [Candidatus Azobacteroides sp.]